jgi:hypothetical protein
MTRPGPTAAAGLVVCPHPGTSAPKSAGSKTAAGIHEHWSRHLQHSGAPLTRANTPTPGPLLKPAACSVDAQELNPLSNWVFVCGCSSPPLTCLVGSVHRGRRLHRHHATLGLRCVTRNRIGQVAASTRSNDATSPAPYGCPYRLSNKRFRSSRHDVVEAMRSIPASHDQTSTALAKRSCVSLPVSGLLRVLDLGEQIALCCGRAGAPTACSSQHPCRSNCQ